MTAIGDIFWLSSDDGHLNEAIISQVIYDKFFAVVG